MKKFTLAAIAAAFVMPVSAEEAELVANLYSGNPVAVTWENTLKIDADKFATVSAGNYISISFEKTTDVIELKADGQWLPGTIYTELGDNTADTKTYITTDMLAKLKEFGLELCGASFTVKEVNVYNDGFNMPDGAIWGGFFWVDSWNTLSLFKTAFDNYAGQRYMDIYLSDDNGDNTGYFIQVMTAFDNPDALWAGNDAITHTAKVATVDLKDVDVETALENVNTLLVQSNPEGGSPYNLTAIVLREDKGTSTGIVDITESGTHADVYNLQGILVKKNVSLSSGLHGLPSGVYIAGGKKIFVK